MGIEHSKEASLYESVRRGDVDSMRRLYRSGAAVNWTSFSGKTPLILACSSPHLIHAARELIEMGADVNYFNYESRFGTPLQRAAQRGLLQTACLLLAHGANPLIPDSTGRNALDCDRDENHADIVRAIESKICFFSGYLRKLGAVRPVKMEKIWVVVLPGDSSLSMDVTSLKMALYTNQNSAKPSQVLSLRHHTFKRPNFSLQDPEFVLTDKLSGHCLKLRSGEAGNKEQLELLYYACWGRKRETTKIDAASRSSQEGSEIAEVSNLPSVEKGKSNDAPSSSSSSLSSSSCVLCTHNSRDAVCVPCGHLACCMACLSEFERKEMGCPVCRSPIEFILKIYPL